MAVFHFFPRLPQELREEIYQIATPPRIVHVRSRSLWDEEEFNEWLSGLTPVQTKQIKLHPFLKYFVHNWREYILNHGDRHSQPTLESYGFTNSKPVHYLWDDPQISINWLLDHPSIAFQLLRKTRLYSTAPIPALLHTCSESRSSLIRIGYRLAFGTRHHEPHTWFHYQNDVLYLEYYQNPFRDGSLLSSSCCVIGEIDPESLQKVRNIALDGACYLLFNESWRYEVSSMIRLLPKLDVLYLVEWSNRALKRLFRDGSRWSISSQDKDHGPKPEMHSRVPWRCIPIEEVDAIFSVLGGYDPDHVDTTCLGHYGYKLRSFQGQSGQYFSTLIDQLTACLEEKRKKTIEHERVVPWQIPRIEIAHCTTEPLARQLVQERHRIWNKFLSLKSRQAPSVQHRRKRVNRPMSPTDIEFQDDWEALNDVSDGPWGDYYEELGYEMEYLVKEGTIFPPRKEFILEP